MPIDTDPMTDHAVRLREALEIADYTVEGVGRLLGGARTGMPGAGMPGTGRPGAGMPGVGDPRPAALPPDDDRPLTTLVRLFLAGAEVPDAVAAGALPLPAAHAAGLVERAPTGVRASLDLRPHADDTGGWWVVSDLGTDVRPGVLPADHVLGVGSASVTLAEWTVRRPVRTALDLGIGCGVQALHLSRHADAVTGTDVNPRALRCAALTAALNGLEWELLAGDATAPVIGRRFDLVVSNPPFVVGPGQATHAYRDSGRAGDALCRSLVRAAPTLLTAGGWLQLIANWLHVAGTRWEDRVAEWVAGTGCDAWIVQREVLDPAEYVALWLRDAGESALGSAAGRARRWLEWFAAERVQAVGFGLVALHAAGADTPVVRVEELRRALPSVPGREVLARDDRMRWLRGADLLGARLVTAPDLRLHQVASRSAGWEVDAQRLVLDGGLRWTEAADPTLVALVAGCDGTATLGDQVAVLAAAYGGAPASVAAAVLPVVAHLVERGMLLPAPHRQDL